MTEGYARSPGIWSRHLAIALLSTCMIAAGAAVALGDDGPPGITTQTKFAPFNPSAPACAVPQGLNKSLAFAQDNEREFVQGIDRGLSMAAQDRGLAYKRSIANNDAAKMEQDVQTFLAAKTGGIVAVLIDPASLSHSLQQEMWAGGYVSTIVAPPATLLLNAPQYATGKVLTDAAVDYIKTKLGGKANVVLLTQDSEFLNPRFAAMRDGLKQLPGVKIVADIAPTPVDKDGGFATMSTILQAHPDVDVVLGADAVVLGALAALESAGKARPDQFLGGIDGEAEAIDDIRKGNGPYKASVSLNSAVFAYGIGYYAADWLEGKSVPQAMDILPSLLTTDKLDQYQKDFADPRSVFKDPARRDAYLKMYGNICYDSRDKYVNFPWSSEAK